MLATGFDGRVNSFFCSEAKLAELTDVVSRPKLARKLAFDLDIARAFVESVRSGSVVVASVPSRFAYPRDPKDEPLVNVALAAGARYLVTWDKDLLDLMKEGNTDGEAVKILAPNLTTLTPPQMLQILRSH